MNRVFDTACVVGGSVAGLLAARALAGHARRVVVLERDDLAAGRPSVPQGRHGHFLQPEALIELERWFPGFIGEAVADGAVLSPPGRHSLFLDSAPLPDLDATMLMASRPFLESQLRRRVAGIPGVEFRHARATGLRYRGRAVAGVFAEGGPATESVLEADLTVDATGKGSSLAHWLGRDGFPAPLTRRVPVGIGYTTMLFRRSPDALVPKISCALDQFTLPADGSGLAAVAAYAIEDDLWQVSGIAYGRDRADATVGDLRAVCAGLPDVFRTATEGDPVGEPETWFHGVSLRREITDLDSFPAGLITIGDAAATYNPIHGLGIASAVSQSALLSTFLDEADDPAGQSRAFLRTREEAVTRTWQQSAAR